VVPPIFHRYLPGWLALAACLLLALACESKAAEPTATVRDLVLPLDEFPLSGYQVGENIPRGTAPNFNGWEREFKNSDSSSEYFWVDILLWDLEYDPKSYLNSEDCQWAPKPGSTMALTGGEAFAPPAGDGVKACKFTFPDDARIFTLRTIHRDAGVFIQANPRSSVNDATTLDFMASLARRQITRIDRLAPPLPVNSIASKLNGASIAALILGVFLVFWSAVMIIIFAIRHKPLRKLVIIGGVGGAVLVVGIGGVFVAQAIDPNVSESSSLRIAKLPPGTTGTPSAPPVSPDATGTASAPPVSPGATGTASAPPASPDAPPISAGVSPQQRAGVLKFLSEFNTITNDYEAALDKIVGPTSTNEDVARIQLQTTLTESATESIKAGTKYISLQSFATEPQTEDIKKEMMRILEGRVNVLDKYRDAVAAKDDAAITRLEPEATTLDEDMKALHEKLQQLLTKYDIKDEEVVYNRPLPIEEGTEFTGELPPVTTVQYLTRQGQTVSAPAPGGLVSLVTTLDGKYSKVYAIITPLGGAVIEGSTDLGLYTIQVTPGKEDEVIAGLLKEPWTVSATPLVLVGPAQQPTEKPAIALDYPYWRDSDKGVCADYHGVLTATIMASVGNFARIMDARYTALDALKAKYETFGTKLPDAISSSFATGVQLRQAMKDGSVVNVSLGAHRMDGDKKLSHEAYRSAEAAFLATIYRVAEDGPDVPVIVSAGNGDADRKGADLTSYVAALSKQFPNAAKKVRIVYATKQDGSRASWSNHFTAGTEDGIEAGKSFIGAPGENVPINTNVPGKPATLINGTVFCDGTSFSAPAVSGLMARMRRAAPNRSADDLWAEFENVTEGKLPWLWPGMGIPLVYAAEGIYWDAFSVSPGTMNLEVGKNNIFKVTVTGKGGIVLDYPSSAFAWSSANPAIAKVDAVGFVDGVSQGRTIVTVSHMGASVAVDVVVTPKASPANVPVSVTITSYSCRPVSHSGSPPWKYFEITLQGTASGPIGSQMRIVKYWRLVASGTIPGNNITASWSPFDVPEQGGTVRGGVHKRQAGEPETIEWTAHAELEYYNPQTLEPTPPPYVVVTIDQSDVKGPITGDFRKEARATFPCW